MSIRLSPRGHDAKEEANNLTFQSEEASEKSNPRYQSS
jgi:hypothetical protein